LSKKKHERFCYFLYKNIEKAYALSPEIIITIKRGIDIAQNTTMLFVKKVKMY